MISNFITPPDFVDDDQHTITIIDADPVDVETLAVLCAGNDESFNIYLYKSEMMNLTWLDSAVERSHVVIINTDANDLSAYKDKLSTRSTSYHYGPKNFLGSTNRIEKLVDYFVLRANERKQHSIDTL
jgi:hypothetical protein